MNFHSIFIGQLSASFELSNDEVYFSKSKYDVFVNGEKRLEDVTTNVFSIYGLEPDKEYIVSIDKDEVGIHTKKASMIAHLKDFRNPSKSVDDTLMFQSAISVIPADSVLYVDKGEYHITSLFLKSDMTLYLEKGATVYGNTDVDAYPLLPGELPFSDKSEKEAQILSWEGNPFEGKTSVINGFYVENVQICGEGTIDGQAQLSDFWKDVKHLKWGRPRIIFFNHSENIVVQGVSVKNTPCWTIHPYFSDHLGFYDIKVSNPKDAPNTDGMDPECCSDVKIIGVYFSVGDDCIALKSGKIYIGQKYKTPTEDAVIRNCYMHEGHGAIVLGSEIGAGLKDITVEKCYFEHTDRGLRIKTRRGRGRDSVIDGVIFKDIVMDHVLTPLVMNMFYFCDPDGKTEYVYTKDRLPVDGRTPYLGNFIFENIKATNAEYALGWFYGLPEMPIKSVTIKNSSFTIKSDAEKGMPAMMSYIEAQSKTGFCFFNVENVILDHVTASGYLGEEVITENVGSLKVI